MKRCVIITYEHGHGYIPWYIRVASRVDERFETYNLRKLGKNPKVSKLHRMIAWCPQLLQNKRLVNTSKKLFKNRNETFLVVHYFT